MDDLTRYKVVLNHEEQYSIWEASRENPPGWRDEGTQGTKQECLDHIEKVWVDMRPLSLRQWMEEMERNPPPLVSKPAPVDDLVDRLCAGSHPVQLISDREDIAAGYVH